MCGGLNGCPIHAVRCPACLQADWVKLMVMPDELDAMRRVWRCCRIDIGEELDLKVRSFGAIFLNVKPASDRAFFISSVKLSRLREALLARPF